MPAPSPGDEKSDDAFPLVVPTGYPCLHLESAIDARTTRHPGHQVSQRIRKRIEEPFGWIKTVAGGRKLRYKGRSRNRAWFLIAGAVYNVLRITALDAQVT